MESKLAKEDLIKAVQDECRRESTDNANLDKLREDVATKMQDSLKKDKLPAIISGTRQSSEENSIFENELQVLSQEIRDKLSNLQRITDTLAKSQDEEINSFLKLKRSMDL